MKRSKRPAPGFAGAQARIRAEAAMTTSAPKFRAAPASETPALAGVLTAARSAIEEGLPKFLDHAGERYRLAFSGAVRVEVFLVAGPAQSLFTGLTVFATPGA
jgi:hypothetical protein